MTIPYRVQTGTKAQKVKDLEVPDEKDRFETAAEDSYKAKLKAAMQAGKRGKTLPIGMLKK